MYAAKGQQPLKARTGPPASSSVSAGPRSGSSTASENSPSGLSSSASPASASLQSGFESDAAITQGTKLAAMYAAKRCCCCLKPAGGLRPGPSCAGWGGGFGPPNRGTTTNLVRALIQ